MNPLKIQTLGMPGAFFQDKRLKFRSRKAFALLIYLAVEKGSHGREKLIDLLWSPSDLRQGRVSLRVALSQIRQALRVIGTPGIVTTNDLVGLEPQWPYHLDLNLIQKALSPQATAVDWQTAVSAYRGDFLEGFNLSGASGYEEWTSWQRQRWHDQMEPVYYRLTTHQLDHGEGVQATQTAVQWVARSALNETAYRCLMEAQARMGDRSAALNTYKHCQHVLKTELNIVPGEEITGLALRIRQGGIGSVRDLSESRTTIHPASFPFVGRATEYNQLVTALRTAVVGNTVVSVVIGTAGMGKTHLVEAFLTGSHFDKTAPDILQGRAYEMGGRLPYQPIVAAIRARLEQENAPEDILDDVWLAELSQLLPELRVRYPDLPLPLTGGADFVRARLFEAVARLGSALAARRPLIFFLDDWQWAQSSSLDMLNYLVQSWSQAATPILLVLPIRQEAMLTTPALQEMLTEIERDVLVNRLELAALTAVDLQQFAQQMTAVAIDDLQPNENNAVQQFSTWLYQKTGGQPFFLNELVSMLVGLGILEPTKQNGRTVFDILAAWQKLQYGHQLPIPPNIRQALLARQGRLREPAAALLWASAVLGRDCTFERLCQVSGVAELDGLSAMEELLNGRFMQEIRSARRPYTFAHDYIREVAYTEAGEARRRLFHRRALTVLEQDAAPPAELTFHALAAQLDEPAFRYSIAAGDAAKQAHAYNEAISHYDIARELAKKAASATKPARSLPKGLGQAVDDQLLRQLYINRGRSLEQIHQDKDAKANYQEMLNLAEERHDLAMKQAALTAQCIIHATHTNIFNPDRARELGEEALVLAQSLNDPTAKARALWCMMLVEFYGGGESQKTLAYGEEALALAQELGLQELAAYIQTNLAWAYFNNDKIEAALTANNATRVIWEEMGNLPMVADAYNMRLYMCRNIGKYADMLAVGPNALRLSQSINNVLNEAMILLNMSDAYCLQGQIGQALASIEASAAITDKNNESWAAYSYFPSFILIYLKSGALEQAEAWADKLYVFRETFMPVFQIYFFVPVIMAKIACGKLQQAESILQHAFAVLDKNNPSAVDMAPLYVADGHLQLALENPAQTRERMEVVVQRLCAIGSQNHLAEAYWLRGKAWLALAEVALAQEAFAKAKVVAEEIGERTILWQILVSLVDVETINNNVLQADKLTEQAVEIVNYIVSQLGSGDLRTSFLAQPRVAQILEA